MSRRDKEFDEILAMLHRLEHNVGRVEYGVIHLLRLLKHHPTAIHSHFEGENCMPATLTVGNTIVQTLTETDATGANVPVVASNLTNTSSDPTIASVVANGDGTFTWTAVGVGTATSTFGDSAFSLSGTDTLEVAAAAQVPTTIISTFGTPA